MNVRLSLLTVAAATALGVAVSATRRHDLRRHDRLRLSCRRQARPCGCRETRRHRLARPAAAGAEMRGLSPGLAGRHPPSSLRRWTGKRITTAVERLDGSGYRAFRLPGPTLNLGPGAWSPNGRRIAFEGWDATRRRKRPLHGERRRRERAAASDQQPGCDATTSRCSTRPTGRGSSSSARGRLTTRRPADLYAVRSERQRGCGSSTRRGTGVRWSFGSPASWSADGGHVAFAAFDLRSARCGLSAVFTITLRGTHLRRITPWGEWTTSARFSPDGRWIAFDRLPVTTSCACDPTARTSARSSPPALTGAARAARPGLRTARISSSSGATPRLRRSGR